MHFIAGLTLAAIFQPAHVMPETEFPLPDEDGNIENNSAVLVIASGTNRVSIEKIQAATGIRLGKANAAFVKENVGFAIGGVPPVGHLSQLTTFLDPDLKAYTVIWAAAGTPFSVFQLDPEALQLLTEGQWLELAEN